MRDKKFLKISKRDFDKLHFIFILLFNLYSKGERENKLLWKYAIK